MVGQLAHKPGEGRDIRVQVVGRRFVDGVIRNVQTPLALKLLVAFAAGEDDLVMVEDVDGNFQPFQQIVAHQKIEVGAQVVEGGIGLEHDEADVGLDAVRPQDAQRLFVLGDGRVLVEAVEDFLSAAFEADEDVGHAGVDQCLCARLVDVVRPGFDAEGDRAGLEQRRELEHPVAAGLAGAEEIGIVEVEIPVVGLGDDLVDFGEDVFRRAGAPPRTAGVVAEERVDVAEGAGVVAAAAAEDVDFAARVRRRLADRERQRVEILHQGAERRLDAAFSFEGQALDVLPAIEMGSQIDDRLFVFAEHRRIDGRAAVEHFLVGEGRVVAVDRQMLDAVVGFQPGQEVEEHVVVLPVVDEVDGQQRRPEGGDFLFDGVVGQVFHVAFDQIDAVARLEQIGGEVARGQAGGQRRVGDVVLAVFRGLSGVFEQ